MKEHIKANRLSFKVGTFEWLNFFGLPVGLIVFSLIMLFFFIKDRFSMDSINNLIAFVVLASFGVITYYIQLRKLKLKTFQLKRNIEEFKKEVRKILNTNKWAIEYDNKSFLLATQRGSVFNLDMIILKFDKSLIKWNVIHHPRSNNSIAALFSLNIYGKKIIKLIKASA